MIVGAGSAEGSSDASNILKPSIARGEIKCVASTTLSEFRRKDFFLFAPPPFAYALLFFRISFNHTTPSVS